MNKNRFNISKKIKRVTAGPGGEALLIIGEEKTAVLDCGMAFCGNQLVENIKKELSEQGNLDYIIISHSHYDHIGGMPYLKKAWPKAKVIGAQHAKEVLQKNTALKTIRELSQKALESYQNSDQFGDVVFQLQNSDLNYRDEDLTVDDVVKENDLIHLGGTNISVLETPGHTDCSLSFYMQPDDIFFLAETMGCPVAEGEVMTSMLKGYDKTLESIKKGQNVGAKIIVAPHYGKVSDEMASQYWIKAREAASVCRDLIENLYQSGASDEEIVMAYRQRYWHGIHYNQQPEEAFLINAWNVIQAIKNEIKNQKK